MEFCHGRGSVLSSALMAAFVTHTEEKKESNQRFPLPQRHGSNDRTGEPQSVLCALTVQRKMGIPFFLMNPPFSPFQVLDILLNPEFTVIWMTKEKFTGSTMGVKVKI